MLGKKLWHERIDELESKYEYLLEKYDIIEERLNKLKPVETEEEPNSPYWNPVTKLYDFKYGRKQQEGANSK